MNLNALGQLISLSARSSGDSFLLPKYNGNEKIEIESK